METHLWSAGARALPVLVLMAAGLADGAMITFNTGGLDCGEAGMCTADPTAYTIDFDDATTSPYTSGDATFTFTTASLLPFVSGSVASGYLAPLNDTGRYLTVGSPNRPAQATITFLSPINYYGFYLGSPDSYNLVQFYEHTGDTAPIASLNGSQLVAGSRTGSANGVYMNFFVNGGGVQRIVLSSTSAALESDNHAYRLAGVSTFTLVPEPSSFALAGLAILAAGCGSRVRRLLGR